MTADELSAIGHLLYGPRWQTALARALGVNDRTVRRWMAGDRVIPAPTIVAIRSLAENQRRTINRESSAPG